MVCITGSFSPVTSLTEHAFLETYTEIFRTNTGYQTLFAAYKLVTRGFSKKKKKFKNLKIVRHTFNVAFVSTLYFSIFDQLHSTRNYTTTQVFNS